MFCSNYVTRKMIYKIYERDTNEISETKAIELKYIETTRTVR